MRDYKLFFIIFFLLMPFLSEAQVRQQKVSVGLGENLKRTERYGFHKIVGAREGGVYTLRVKEKRFLGISRKQKAYYLQYFNEKLNLEESVPLKLKNGEDLLSFESVVQLGRKLYLFSSGYKLETGEETLYCQELDSESLKPKGKMKPVLRTLNHRKAGFYTFSLSPDQTKLLLLHRKPSAMDKKESFTVVVLDEELLLLWKKENFHPFADNIFKLEKSSVDNKGNVYLLSTLYKEQRRIKRKGAPDYQYHLISYKKGGQETNEYSIQLANRFLTDIQVVVNEENDIIGGGFYSAKGSWEIEGSYFFRIDGKTNEVVSRSVRQFTPGFLSQSFPESSPGNLVSGKGQFQLKLKDFRLHDILLREDGSAVLIGEQYFVTTETNILKRNNKLLRSKTRYHYSFDDIIMVNVNPEGEISWTNKIAKNQHSMNDGGIYSSYAVSMQKDDLYFVFNQQPEKQEKGGEGSAAIKKRKAQEALLVRVDGSGKQMKEVLPALNEAEIRFIPRATRNLRNNEWVVLGNKKKKNCFVKITFSPDEPFFAEKK